MSFYICLGHLQPAVKAIVPEDSRVVVVGELLKSSCRLRRHEVRVSVKPISFPAWRKTQPKVLAIRSNTEDYKLRRFCIYNESPETTNTMLLEDLNIFRQYRRLLTSNVTTPTLTLSSLVWKRSSEVLDISLHFSTPFHHSSICKIQTG